MDGVMGNKKQESSKSKRGEKTSRKPPSRHNKIDHTETVTVYIEHARFKL